MEYVGDLWRWGMTNEERLAEIEARVERWEVKGTVEGDIDGEPWGVEGVVGIAVTMRESDYDWLLARIRELEAQAARDAEVLEALRDAHWKALTCVSMFQKWAEYGDRPSFEERAEKTRAMHEATRRWGDLRDAALAARGEG